MVNSNQRFTKGALSNLLQGVQAADTGWRDIVDVVQSDERDETYDSFNAPGRVVRDQGVGFIAEEAVSFNFLITNNTYTLAMGVKRDALDDDRLDAFMGRVRLMGRRLANFQFERALEVLTTGDANLAFDNSNFFGNSHNDFDSLDNSITSQAAAGDAVPTLTELETQYAIMEASLLEFTDRSGANIWYDQGNLKLITGPQLKTVARRMLEAQLGTNGQTQIHEGDATLMTVPVNHMQDTATVKEIFLLKLDADQKPLILQERSGITDKTWEDEGDRTMNFGAEMRFNVGLQNPAAAIHQVFTT